MKLYYHYLNTQQDKDILCLDFPQHEKWFIGASVTDDGKYLLINIHEGTNPNCQVYYVDLQLLPDGKITRYLDYVILIDNFDAMYDYVTNDGVNFTFLTTHQAPMQKLIRCSHLLSIVVTCCQLLSLLSTVVTCCQLLSLLSLLSIVVTCCHLLALLSTAVNCCHCCQLLYIKANMLDSN